MSNRQGLRARHKRHKDKAVRGKFCWFGYVTVAWCFDYVARQLPPGELDRWRVVNQRGLITMPQLDFAMAMIP